jgi:hypothetical protein
LYKRVGELLYYIEVIQTELPGVAILTDGWGRTVRRDLTLGTYKKIGTITVTPKTIEEANKYYL